MSLVVVYAACAVDSADKALLPSSFAALEAELRLDKQQLGALSAAQALAFALALPGWGAALQAGWPARRLLAVGCAGWAACTALLAVSRSYALHLLLRASRR